MFDIHNHTSLLQYYFRTKVQVEEAMDPMVALHTDPDTQVTAMEDTGNGDSSQKLAKNPC